MMPIPLMFVSLSQFSVQETALIPLAIAALLLDSVIIAAWYFFGVILNNNGTKQSAKGELYQLAGTAMLIVLIIAVITVFSGSLEAALSNTNLMSPAALSTSSNSVCSYVSGSQFTLLNSGLSGTLCNIVSGNSGLGPITSKIDYPLAASGIVISNLTNQEITNLNSYYQVDLFIGFLSKLSPKFNICVADVEDSGECLIPEPPTAFLIDFSSTPYSGLSLIYNGMTILGIILTSGLYSFILQLIFILLFLFAWPYLIFIGIILRSNFITRKVGGLFIAIAIGTVFFYPMVFATQYLTLGNGLTNIPNYGDITSTLPNSISSIYGYNSIASNSLTAIPGYNLNFYILPSIQNIAEQNGVWPGTAIISESADIGFLLIPFLSAIYTGESLSTSFIGGIPQFSLPIGFTPQQAEQFLFAALNAYGVSGITAYLLPVMDILITITAIIGLSGLLGGDTQLMGLSRLV
jgi:hypothetical protein